MARSKPATREDSPLAWQLWNHADPDSGGFEALLYSDTVIAGAPYLASPVATGPLVLFPTGAEQIPGAQPTGQLLVRILHAEPTRTSGYRGTPYEHYLGIGADGEIAALLSLVLDIRLRSGGHLRNFTTLDSEIHDPLGVPQLHNLHPPTLVPVPLRRRQLPQLDRPQVPIHDAIPYLKRYCALDPGAAIALARAARAYADALWVADADNQQAWLWLITALEVLAVYEDEETMTPLDALRAMQRESRDEDIEAAAAALPPEIGAVLVRNQRATAKFRAFVRRYKPDPPTERPPRKHNRVDWERIDRAMNTVYGHRSAFLHSGRPMPPGMVGTDLERWDGPPDECVGVQIGGFDTHWEPEEVPMHLWVAAYITRGAILNWWRAQTG